MKLRILQHETVAPGVTTFVMARLPPPFEPQLPEAWNIPPTLGFDPLRQQHNAFQLLEALPSPAPGEATLGLVGVDLFLPVLTYVFGASLLGHRKSLLSAARLTGPEGDPALLRRRALVEALHELGHGVGLPHCPLASCPMHQSFHPESIDLKDAEFCPACRDKLLRLCSSL